MKRDININFYRENITNNLFMINIMSVTSLRINEEAHCFFMNQNEMVIG